MPRDRLAVLAGVVALVGSGGCADAPGVPEALVDGTAAVPVPVELQGVDEPALLTGVTVLPGVPSSERSATCLAEWDRRPVRRVVERVGVLAETVTLLEGSGRAILGCDDGEGPREADRRWCGTAFGRLDDGRLRDPRLDVLCTTEDGVPLGLAWIEPAPGTAYVAVAQNGYVEVYEPAGDLPVRVSTTEVDVGRATAGFEVSEHAASGRLLQSYRLEAAVAG